MLFIGLEAVRGNLRLSQRTDYENRQDQKMKEGDVYKQPMVPRQILALHNLEHSITFRPQDFTKIQMSYGSDTKIANCIVKRVLTDRESTVKVMFYSTFQQIGLPDEKIVQVTTPLAGFDRASMALMGAIK